MNQADKQEFKIIHDKIDELSADIKFIKENLFNPHEGLWAETKLNTTFRQDTKKWRTMITSALVAVFGKWVYDILG